MSEKPSGFILRHQSAWLRLNERDGKIFLTISKSKEETMTISLSPEEALAVSSFLQLKAQYLILHGYIGRVTGKKNETKNNAPKQDEIPPEE